jgi:hypothetical protein
LNALQIVGFSLAFAGTVAYGNLVQAQPLPPNWQAGCGARPTLGSLGVDPSPAKAVDRYTLSVSTTNLGTTEVRFRSKESGGELLFIGTRHITGPEPALFDQFAQDFSEFNPTSVFLEVADTSYIQSLPTDKDSVIKSRGEPSYLGFIGRENGVRVLPLEASPSFLFSELRKKFNADQIILANTLQQVQISRDRQRLFGEALERAARASIQEQVQIARDRGDKPTLTNIYRLTLAVSKLWPGLDWRQAPAEWSNPLLADAETGGIYLNRLRLQNMDTRDRYSLRILLERVSRGERVLALAGRTHAENHRLTLSCAMAR